MTATAPSANASSRADYRWLAIVLAGGLAVYQSCLRGAFLADDFGYVQLYARTTLFEIPALFASDWSRGIWGTTLQELRPLTGLTYWLDFRLWGTAASGYHAANLVFYGIGIVGLYALIVEAGRGFAVDPRLPPRGAAIAAALFLLHPAHVEAVAWIAGRTDLLAAAASLWSLCALLRFWRTGSARWLAAGSAAFAAGVFFKETAATTPALFLGFALLATNVRGKARRLAAALLPLVTIVIVWYGLRLAAFGSPPQPEWTVLAARLPYYAGEAMSLPMPNPAWLAAGLVIAVAIAALAIRRRSRLAAGLVVFCVIVWPLVHLVPLTAVTYESPRHIFLLVAGPVALLSVVVARTINAGRAATVVGLAAVAIVGSLWGRQTIVRLAQWERASAYSRQLLSLLDDQTFAPDAIVVFRSAPRVPVWFWNWSVPFALQEPFLDGFHARVIAPDAWYCCDRLKAEREALTREFALAPPHRIRMIEFDAALDRFVLRY